MSEFKFSRDDSLWQHAHQPAKRKSSGAIPNPRDRNPLFTLFRPLKNVWDKLLLEAYCYFFTCSLTLYYSLFLRRKMSHNNGILLEGEVEIVKNQSFPQHKFFEPGKKFACRVRHAAAGFMDDAMLCVRSMSIKFSNQRVESPLDLEMNTGRSLFWSVRNFFEFAAWKKEYKGTAYQKFWLRYPAGQQAGQDSVCHNPTSYTKLAYYSQTPTLFVGEDGIERYAKYRCIPFDGQIESQNNSVSEIGYFWGDQRVEPGVKKHRNYLKDEIKNRLDQQGSIQYRIQIQLLDSKEADINPAIFNSNLHWDESITPWHDLAIVTLKKTLSYEESVLTYFSHANCPTSLGIIPAKSIDDYNSLNHMRLRVGLAKKARIFAIKHFGMPKPLPDLGPRNIDELTCEKIGYQKEK